MGVKHELSYLQNKYKCLFNRGVSPSVSSSDVTATTAIPYAVTVNIQPTKLINRRQWKLYSSDQQRQILMRIEKSIRTKNPSIVLNEIHFEECPILKQQHFHCLYTMPPEFTTVLETYYNRVIGSTGKQTKPWRHFVMKPVDNVKGWVDYIRKDINNSRHG